MPGYYGVKLGRHWNGLKIEIWDLQDLHSNAVYLVSKGEIIFILKIIKTYRVSSVYTWKHTLFHLRVCALNYKTVMFILVSVFQTDAQLMFSGLAH